MRALNMIQMHIGVFYQKIYTNKGLRLALTQP